MQNAHRETVNNRLRCRDEETADGKKSYRKYLHNVITKVIPLKTEIQMWQGIANEKIQLTPAAF